MAERPVLVVPFDRGAASPWEVTAAAPPDTDVVFVYPADSPHRATVLPPLQECAPTLVVSDPDEVLTALADRDVRGVLTLSDRTLALAAVLAEAFGCRFHTPEVAAALTDKQRQRELLRSAGLPTPGLLAPATPADLVAAAVEVGFPCIVKPRQSCESRHTYRLSDRAAARTAAESAAAVWDTVGGFLVEEMLRGDPEIAGTDWGPYVSVESMVVDGSVHNLAVTGKLPLIEPFREAGHFFPSTLAPATLAEVGRATADAITALGIRHGACHTEVMLTSDGPRIIEVNGRLGGFVSSVIESATGVSILELTVAAAVGDHSMLEGLPARLANPSGVGFTVFGFPAPDGPDAGTVHKVHGLSRVRRLPGVTAAVLTARRGDRVDPAMGTGSSVVHVYGLTSDHDSLAGLTREVTATIRVELLGPVEAAHP